MNCLEFERRMQLCLDERLPLDSDRELQRHASQCESCQAQLQAWCQIASVLSVPSTLLEHRNRAADGLLQLRWVAALAAVLLVAITIVGYGRRSDLTNEFVSTDSIPPTTLAQGVAVDPAAWWHGMQSRDWVGQTMPTVKSVQEGVAPLGRSLMRAVTILTLGSGDKTS